MSTAQDTRLRVGNFSQNFNPLQPGAAHAFGEGNGEIEHSIVFFVRLLVMRVIRLQEKDRTKLKTRRKTIHYIVVFSIIMYRWWSKKRAEEEKKKSR